MMNMLYRPFDGCSDLIRRRRIPGCVASLTGAAADTQ
jgi:hypothetical protein